MEDDERTDGRPRDAHWDTAYRDQPAHSWNQATPATSLSMLDAAGISADESLIDVGGGDSSLVEVLLHRGLRDLTVLDVSAEALAIARARLGARHDTVTWVQQDLLEWHPTRHWDVWHDRAVFHFLTRPDEREHYREALRGATRVGSRVIVGTFAADGPTVCSGLPTTRYTPDALIAELGPGFDPITADRELHTTPTGAVQPFTWVAMHRFQ